MKIIYISNILIYFSLDTIMHLMLSLTLEGFEKLWNELSELIDAFELAFEFLRFVVEAGAEIIH